MNKNCIRFKKSPLFDLRIEQKNRAKIFENLENLFLLFPIKLNKKMVSSNIKILV